VSESECVFFFHIFCRLAKRKRECVGIKKKGAAKAKYVRGMRLSRQTVNKRLICPKMVIKSESNLNNLEA